MLKMYFLFATNSRHLLMHLRNIFQIWEIKAETVSQSRYSVQAKPKNEAKLQKYTQNLDFLVTTPFGTVYSYGINFKPLRYSSNQLSHAFFG